jgi:hypothetical protein
LNFLFKLIWVFFPSTGTKFFVVCEPGTQHMEGLLKVIYELYTDYVLKNPFYEMEMPIRCELFDINLSQAIQKDRVALLGRWTFLNFASITFVIFHFHLCICQEIFQFSFMLFFSLVAVCGCVQLAFHENLIFLNYFFSVFGLFWFVMSKINFKK